MRPDDTYDAGPAFTATQLLQIHAATLFLTDAAGRLRFNADPGYPEHDLDPAPRFWLGRTSHPQPH